MEKTPTLGDPSSSLLFGAATPHPPSLLRFLCCIRSQSIDPTAADATGKQEASSPDRAERPSGQPAKGNGGAVEGRF